MTTYWYFEKEGTSIGPIDAEKIKEAIAVGTVKTDTLVWSEGMQKWRPASSTELAQYFDAVSSTPVLGTDGRVHQDHGRCPPERSKDYYDESTFSWHARLFSMRGRIGRVRYLITLFLAFTLMVVGVSVFAGMLDSSNQLAKFVGMFGFIATGAACFWTTAVAVVKRIHDRDSIGFWGLIMLVPYVGFLFGLILLVAPGTDGNNRFGPKPVNQ